MDDLMGKIQEVLSDEESMKQLNELASSLFSSSDTDECSNKQDTKNIHKSSSESSSSGFDFDLNRLLTIGQVMGSVSEDKNAELLLALRPLLKEERQAKVDKAVKMLKLFAVWSVLKDSGMLSDFL